MSSLWNNHGDLFIGRAGSSNQLMVANGARVNSANGFIGQNYSGANTAIVSGSGSLWNLLGALTVGNTGSSNRLIVTDGGHIYSIGGGIDSLTGTPNPGKGNVALVTGPDSTWLCNGPFLVGTASSFNQLTLENGGTLVATGVSLGSGAGSFQNLIMVSNGHLVVTNVARTATLRCAAPPSRLRAAPWWPTDWLPMPARRAFSSSAGEHCNSARSPSRTVNHSWWETDFPRLSLFWRGAGTPWQVGC
jgi:T5SS/PEP-CTERM-associated repeat protein